MDRQLPGRPKELRSRSLVFVGARRRRMALPRSSTRRSCKADSMRVRADETRAARRLVAFTPVYLSVLLRRSQLVAAAIADHLSSTRLRGVAPDWHQPMPRHATPCGAACNSATVGGGEA